MVIGVNELTENFRLRTSFIQPGKSIAVNQTADKFTHILFAPKVIIALEEKAKGGETVGTN